MTDPKPCPFCGGTKINVIGGFRWRRAECQECEALAGPVRIQTTGPDSQDEREREAASAAIEAWNERTDDSTHDPPSERSTMTWIKIEDSIAFGNRAAIAAISVRDFVNHSGRNSRDFFELLRTGVSPELMETELRNILIAMFPKQQAKDWVMFQCGFNMPSQSIHIAVSHPSFDEIPMFNELPVLVPHDENRT